MHSEAMRELMDNIEASHREEMAASQAVFLGKTPIVPPSRFVEVPTPHDIQRQDRSETQP
jgi:hypothetical protein